MPTLPRHRIPNDYSRNETPPPEIPPKIAQHYAFLDALNGPPDGSGRLPRPTLDRMPFGRYRGLPFHHIPLDYLQWLLRDCTLSEALHRAVAEMVDFHLNYPPVPPDISPGNFEWKEVRHA